MKRKPSHPGRIFKDEFMKPLNLSVPETAKKLGVEIDLLSNFIHEEAPLTPDLAVSISKVTGTGIDMWLKMDEQLNQWRQDQGYERIAGSRGPWERLQMRLAYWWAQRKRRKRGNEKEI